VVSPRLTVAVVATLIAAPVSFALAAPTDAGQPLRGSGLHVPFAGTLTVEGQLRGAQRDRLIARHEALARKLGEHRSPADARRMRTWSTARLRAANAQLASRRDMAAGPPAGAPAVLAKIAECESHGNPRAIGGGGLYRGAFQMTTSIWASVGGHGDPASAPLAEQYRRAALLYQRSGPGQWPVCGA
jgi:hypothetical protein